MIEIRVKRFMSGFFAKTGGSCTTYLVDMNLFSPQSVFTGVSSRNLLERLYIETYKNAPRKFAPVWRINEHFSGRFLLRFNLGFILISHTARFVHAVQVLFTIKSQVLTRFV